MEEQIKLISFTFGCLDANTIKTFKDNRCLLIGTGTATCLREAMTVKSGKLKVKGE